MSNEPTQKACSSSQQTGIDFDWASEMNKNAGVLIVIYLVG
jgi:hypothetical protein